MGWTYLDGVTKFSVSDLSLGLLYHLLSWKGTILSSFKQQRTVRRVSASHSCRSPLPGGKRAGKLLYRLLRNSITLDKVLGQDVVPVEALTAFSTCVGPEQAEKCEKLALSGLLLIVKKIIVLSDNDTQIRQKCLMLLT